MKLVLMLSPKRMIKYSGSLFFALTVCIFLLMFTANQDRKINKCHLRELKLPFASALLSSFFCAPGDSLPVDRQ